jgi:hypothetical protein
MDDITTSLIVVFFTGIIVAGIFYFTNKVKKERSAAIESLAVRKGWLYQPIRERLAWGVHLNGTNWELIAESRSVGQVGDSGSSNIEQSTIWKMTSAEPLTRNFLIGPRLTGNASVPISVLQTVGGLFGGEAAQIAGMTEIDLSIPEFHKKFIILGNNNLDSVTLRMSPIPRLLLEWPGKIYPVIIASGNSIKISVNGHRMDQPHEIERMVLLGEAIETIAR